MFIFTVHSAPSSSAQTLLSNLHGAKKKEKKKKTSPDHRTIEIGQYIISDDCNNSIDTDMRLENHDDYDENQSIQSDYSEISAQWDGKENRKGNLEYDNHKPPAQGAPPNRTVAMPSMSDESSIRRSGSSASFHEDRGLTQWHPANDHTQKIQQTRNISHPEVIPSGNNLHVDGYMHQQQPSTRGRQQTRVVTHDRSVSSVNSSAKKIRKMDLYHIFQQQHENIPPARQRRTPILGSEAMAQWQRGVERAALDSHRTLARSNAGIFRFIVPQTLLSMLNVAITHLGISFGPHPGNKPLVSRFMSPQRAHSVDRSTSSIGRVRSNSFTAYTGDLRGGSLDFTLSSSMHAQSSVSLMQLNNIPVRYVLKNESDISCDSHLFVHFIFFHRASVDNSNLYGLRFSGPSQDEFDHHNISLEELAGNFVLGSDWEERQIRAQSNFSKEVARDVLPPPKPSQPVTHHDIEMKAYHNYIDPVALQASQSVAPAARSGKRTSAELSAQSLSQPKFETADQKPSKPTPAAKVEGITNDPTQKEAPQLNIPDTSMGQASISISQEGFDRSSSSRKNHSRNLEIDALLNMLEGNVGAVDDNSGNQSRVVHPMREMIQAVTQHDVGREHNADIEYVEEVDRNNSTVLESDESRSVNADEGADEADEYMLWLEQQVKVAVDAEGNSVPSDSNSDSGGVESDAPDVPSEEFDDEVCEEFSPPTIITTEESYVEIDKLQSPAAATRAYEAKEKEEFDKLSDYSTPDSTPAKGSPPGNEPDTYAYPPTPSPMPAVKHPRDLAMKAQQQTPAAEWNPLTRILNPEDNSADIYPRYHA